MFSCLRRWSRLVTVTECRSNTNVTLETTFQFKFKSRSCLWYFPPQIYKLSRGPVESMFRVAAAVWHRGIASQLMFAVTTRRGVRRVLTSTRETWICCQLWVHLQETLINSLSPAAVSYAELREQTWKHVCSILPQMSCCWSNCIFILNTLAVLDRCVLSSSSGRPSVRLSPVSDAGSSFSSRCFLSLPG